jgi:ADP-ribosyl-[dinitrogen reductase] hydrolase
MSSGDAQAREDQFLGALLGLAIGDALGRPVRGLSADEVAESYGEVRSYIATAPLEEGQPESGEISDKAEVALCLVESLTTNDGIPDPENIIARMNFLTVGPSSASMSASTIQGVGLALENGGQVPDSHQPPAELPVAVRGVPIGLLQSVGAFDREALVAESAIVSKLSHGGEQQARLTTAVALAIAEAGRTRSVPDGNALGLGTATGIERELLTTLQLAGKADSFAGGLSTVVSRGGEADSTGAIAGAVLGARFGASGIPQDLIDNLDARIYLTLAAPWFYRTAIRRAGTVIDLRVVP